jgi:hypothetical protein
MKAASSNASLITQVDGKYPPSLAYLLLVPLFLTILWLTSITATPPSAVDSGAPMDVFSAGRAKVILSELLAEGVPQ